MSKSSMRWRVGVAVAILALLTGEALAQASRTRPGGGGGGTSPSARAGGTARYGHGGYGRSHSHVRIGYYPWWWYGHGWGWYGFPYREVYVLDGKRTGPGTVEIDVRPRKATVRLDGENVGRAKDYNGSWNVLVLEPGRYLLELERDGYRTLQIPLEVESAAHYHILERLEEGEGLDPRSATWEDVAAAEADAGASEDAGTEGGLELETRPAPALRRGFLRLEVTPRDAAVYLDGEFLASGDELSRLHGALAVAGGEHVVEVVRPGFETRRIEVLVEGEEPVVVRVALETN